MRRANSEDLLQPFLQTSQFYGLCRLGGLSKEYPTYDPFPVHRGKCSEMTLRACVKNSHC
jgi:hypothetical protein